MIFPCPTVPCKGRQVNSRRTHMAKGRICHRAGGCPRPHFFSNPDPRLQWIPITKAGARPSSGGSLEKQLGPGSSSQVVQRKILNHTLKKGPLAGGRRGISELKSKKPIAGGFHVRCPLLENNPRREMDVLRDSILFSGPEPLQVAKSSIL